MRKIIVPIIFVIILISTATVVYAAPPPDGPLGLQRAIEVQEDNSEWLLEAQGVVGTAVSTTVEGRPVISVFTDSTGVRGLPVLIDSVPVQVVVTGEFTALKPTKDPPGKPPKDDGGATSTMDWWERPVPIGVSTGAYHQELCLAGTIGARVTDGTDVYALSNNHVYALENQAYPGSFVVQPGMVDTDCMTELPKNLLGVLYPYVELDFGGINFIDAAIAYTDTETLGNSTPDWGYGTPKTETVSAYIGQRVKKFGRTTELTSGTVTHINAMIEVGYRNGTALFMGQIIVQSRKRFIGPGDSGSLLVTHPRLNPVGLLFAGNEAGTLAVANNIDLVLELLGFVNGKTLMIDGQ